MKLKRARIGEKFVYPDKAGVWEKLPEGKAKMVFGIREDVGMVLDETDPEDYVYVIFEGKGQKPKDEPKVQTHKRDWTPTEPAPIPAPAPAPKPQMPKKGKIEEGDLGCENGVQVILTDDEVIVARCKGVPPEIAMMLTVVDIVRLVPNGGEYMIMDRGFDMANGEVQLEVKREMGE